jgi:hypothetical protein
LWVAIVLALGLYGLRPPFDGPAVPVSFVN